MIAAYLLFAGFPAAHAQISVGANTQVSVDLKHAAHTEYFADADPGDANRLVVCSMVVDPTRSRLSTSLYLSTNHGATWKLIAQDTVGRYGSSWDPSCAFGPGGIIHFGTIPTPVDGPTPRPPTRNRYVRSTDGGKTWDPPATTPFLDNEDLAIDWTNGPMRGRIYSVGTQADTAKPPRSFNHVTLFYSADSGRTYQGPVAKYAAPGTDHWSVGAPVVLNDGRLLIPLAIDRARPRVVPGQPAPPVDSAAAARRDSIPANTIAVMPAFDGGTRFGDPSRVAVYTPCRTTSGGPAQMAVDRSSGPFRNRTYVAFVDNEQGRCQVMLSWSDNGTTWSMPLPVDDPRVPTDSTSGPDAFFPLVRVNDRGVVGITWYDRRETRQNQAFRQRFTASLDGGESVMRSVPVSTAATTFARGTDREPYFGLSGRQFRAAGAAGSGTMWIGVATGLAYRTYDMVGDYGGMAVRTDGVFHPVWVDNRSGVPQLYTAAVTVNGAAKRGAERDAPLGRNVTDSVTVITTSTTFDPATCSIRLGFDLINQSSGSLKLPLTVRVNKMLSQFGVPRAGGAADDMGRPLWSIGSAGQLAKDSVATISRTIVLDDCTTLGGTSRFSVRTDARMNSTPAARLAGPKMLAIEASVFERR